MKFAANAVPGIAFAFVFAGAASLVACGGGGGSSGSGPIPTNPTTGPSTTPTSGPSTTPSITPATPPAATPTPSPVPISTAPAFPNPSPAPPNETNVLFDFGIPHSSIYEYAHSRRPFYISPKTVSLGVVAAGSHPGSNTFNLPGNYCIDTQTTLYCQVYEAVLNGQYTFTLTTYMDANGSGPPLSIGTTPTVTLNGTTQQPLPVTLNAVVAGVHLSLANANPPVGKAAYDTLHTVLTDAAGQTIASDSQYNSSDALYNAVTLSTNNATDGPLYSLKTKTTSSTYRIGALTDVSGIYAYYDGVKTGPITYSASVAPVPGITPSVTPAVLTP